ncbi:unnamed protein product [Calicophoron daubneyi]|uniref:Uncharacterized protein n=1 Tax=Calicophoron daubneyi TaxID=300641 RepID=A0AAV2TZA2_CALDB
MTKTGWGHWLSLLVTSIATAFLASKITFVLLLLYDQGGEWTRRTNILYSAVSTDDGAESGPDFLVFDQLLTSSDDDGSADLASVTDASSLCRMETCFDFSRCTTKFKVYIYPLSSEHAPPSASYVKILRAISRSGFLTYDPHEACLFIPSLDTLDRDPLSPEFRHLVSQQLTRLPFWNELPRSPSAAALDADLESNGKCFTLLLKKALFKIKNDTVLGVKKPPTPGRNHLLFNFYAGTWPLYKEEEYRLPLGQAMLAKASISTTHIRPKFDISLPLIHQQHPEVGGLTNSAKTRLRSVARRPLLLSFKGKRYVSGIGSASRNALFHLHNGNDIIMLTTCRHGTDWTRYADRRCAVDMAEYDKYDYEELMHNSTFCLVPRGRRLGSYRFLEALQSSCIPVMLSNDWELPFSEVIDWRRAVIWADERLLLTLPLLLRRIPDHQIMELRQQVAFLWNTYISSVESIVLTTLEIIRDRVSSHARSYTIWNSPPGALILAQKRSTDTCMVPLSRVPEYCHEQIDGGFTIVIPIRSHLCERYKERMDVFKNTVFRSPSLRKVILVWECDRLPPAEGLNSLCPVELRLIVPEELRYLPLVHGPPSPSVRFLPFPDIQTLAVFAFTMNLNLTTDQVEFGYSTWREFPNRLIGFQTAAHYWNVSSHLWEYDDTPNLANYSIIQMNAAFYHRHYHYLYWQLLNLQSLEVVDVFADCEDLLFNSLVGHLTQGPSVKLLSHEVTRASSLPWLRENENAKNTSMKIQRSACLQAFAEHFASPSSSTFWSSRQPLETDEQVVRKVGTLTTYLPLFHSSVSFIPQPNGE